MVCSDQKTIVLLINDLKGNGAERVVITLADAIQQAGHRCLIICFKKLQELPSANQLDIRIFPMSKLRWIPRQWRAQIVAPLLDRFILRHTGKTPDLVVSNLLPVDRIMCASRLPNVYLTMHSTLSRELLNSDDKGAKQKMLSRLETIYTRKPVICVSQGVLADFVQLFPTHPSAQHIYNPININYIRSSATAINPVKQADYLVHVGKFNRAKRHDRLLKAYANSQVKTPLVLVGQGPLQENNKQLAKALGIDDQVHFIGFQSNPYPIIAGAKGMLFSSDFEGLGMVIMEALILDVPVISTDCPSGPNELLPPENLVPLTDNVEVTFAEKIRSFCAEPGAFRSTLPEAFAPEAILNQYLMLTENKSNQHEQH